MFRLIQSLASNSSNLRYTVKMIRFFACDLRAIKNNTETLPMRYRVKQLQALLQTTYRARKRKRKRRASPKMSLWKSFGKNEKKEKQMNVGERAGLSENRI